VEACDPFNELGLYDELCNIKKASAWGVSSSRVHSDRTTWSIWTEFCLDLTCDPFHQSINNPILLLQIFAERYRVETLAPSATQVKSRTVEGALRAIGQTFAALGQRDPRLQPSGKLDFRLHRQLQSYKKDDPPPHRVKPIPLQLLHAAVAQCYRARSVASQAIADMLIVGFFFLLRPGEYAATANPDAAPFRLCDVHILLHSRRLDPLTCIDQELTAATHVALEFTTQKNGVRNELVGLGRSGHPVLCPVLALCNRVRHLRLHNAP
jgi:hypothetical protein